MAAVFEQIVTEGLGDASYLVGDDGPGIAALIDPLADVDRYIALARRHRLAITHIFQTHVHEDFLGGATTLASRLGGATVYASAHDAPRYGYANQPVRDGDRFAFGGTVLTARHTPGHTPEHLSFWVAQEKSPEAPWAVLSGGSLLVGGAGRPDLLGADRATELAKAQFRTLHHIYAEMPDGVTVYPAHVHGSPCGASLGERNSTTIGHERRHNRLMQTRDEAGFIRQALDGLPPKPRYYPRLKDANIRGDLAPDASIRPLPPEPFGAAASATGAVVVDTRHMLAFGAGHVAGAINIGAGGKLSIWAGWMVDADAPLLLVVDDDSGLDTVLDFFRRTGFGRFDGYLAGGMTAWANAGLPMRKLPQWSVQCLAASRHGRAVLDVRAPAEFAKGHIPGARDVFVADLPDRLGSLDRQRPWAVYCDSGYRATIAASLMLANGFADVVNVPGSWQAWQAAGLPTER